MSKDKNLIAILMAVLAAALIALLFFSEAVGRRLWMAIALVTIASILLSIDDGSIGEALTFSRGSLLVHGATICWIAAK
jgi:hypothetical protein